MKHFITKACLIFSLMLFTLLTSAQITITADNVPTAGTNYLKGIDDLPLGINPGTPGAGRTWDFSPLITDNIIAYSYVNPLATPRPDYFPGANLALHSSDTAFSYLYSDEDVFLMLGMVMEYQGQQYSFDYTPDLVLFNFPFTMGTQLSQDYFFEWIYANNEDSIRFKDHVTRNVEADAFGTVTLPSGSYNAIRATVTQENKDSLWGQILGNWMLISVTVTQSNYYDWYTDDPDVDISLVSLKYDETWTTLESAEFFKESSVGVEDEAGNATVDVYPNPAEERIFVRMPEFAGCTLQLINLAGEYVLEQEMTSESQVVNIQGLNPGIYLCRILGRNSGSVYLQKILLR